MPSIIRRRFVVPSIALGTSLLLSACGGGGGGGSSPSVPTPTPTPTAAPDTCTSVSSAGRRPATRSQSGTVSNQLYVTYHGSAGARGVQGIDRAAGAQRGFDVGAENGVAHRAVILPPGADAARAAAALRANSDVVDVQPVHTRSLLSVTAPNDPLADTVDQWYLYKTNVNPGGWATAPQGLGVSIAVVDTGIDETNADFVSKIDFRESIVNGVVTAGANSTSDRSVQDTNGHGTNVAGLAAAATDNGYGFAGVGNRAHLLIYKVFPDATATSDCQTAASTDEALAVRDAVARGAGVINLSLGSPQSGGADPAEQDAVEFAISQGVTVVAAGGNDTAAVPDFPGGYPGVISVGASAAVDNNGGTYGSIVGETIASYSNSGVTLVAPGGDASGTSDNDFIHWIEGYSTTTAAKASDQCSNSGGVCRVLFNGTSQATPQVAGTVALMEAVHGGPRTLSPAAVTAILQANSDSIGASAARQGAGRLNAGRAVSASH